MLTIRPTKQWWPLSLMRWSKTYVTVHTFKAVTSRDQQAPRVWARVSPIASLTPWWTTRQSSVVCTMRALLWGHNDQVVLVMMGQKKNLTGQAGIGVQAQVQCGQRRKCLALWDIRIPCFCLTDLYPERLQVTFLQHDLQETLQFNSPPHSFDSSYQHQLAFVFVD